MTDKKQKPKLLKLASVLFKVTLATFAILWIVFAQVASTFISIDDIAYPFEKTFGFEADSFLSEDVSSYSSESVDNFFTTTFFEVFLLTSTLVSILGVLILSRKRSFYEALLLFLAFLIPRRRKNWGTVYDNSNKKPIAFAAVRATRISEKDENELFVSETVSDLDGRYKLLLEDPSEEFLLKAQASGYLPFSSKYKSQTGEVTEDIPLAKYELIALKLRELLSYFNSKLSGVLIWSFYVLSYLYLIAAILYLITYPDSLYSYINLVLFIVSIAWNNFVIYERYHFSPGKIINQRTKGPLSDVLVKVFNGDRQVVTSYSNSKGVVKFNLPEGEYLVSMHKPGFTSVESEGGLSKVYIKENGYLGKDLVLKQVSSGVEASQSSKLLNPFS